ncbi:MAG: carbohydrate kinase family protein [Halanaerobiales bacterium]|nr:carbohydrate kinase family protein [Halanaerobiales bacterium]
MILVFGDINLDIVVNLQEEINFDTDSSSNISFKGGGSAANFSFWLNYLKEKVILVAKTGNDLAADYLKKEFKNKDIKFINIVNIKKETGKVVVFLNSEGERTMLTDRGANSSLNPADIKKNYFDGIDHIHLGGYSFFGGKNMEKSALKIIEIANKKNIEISFDPSSYSEIKKYGSQKILNQTKGIKFCFPNLQEGRVLSGKERPKEIIEVLNRYYQNVILTMGKDGCYISNSEQSMFIKQKLEIKKADTIGAGDAFAAGFISCYLKNNDINKAVRKANLTAFKCVKNIGGRPDSHMNKNV